jgi:hypothetical protein
VTLVTLQTETITPRWNWGGSVAYLRIYASTPFYASNGEYIASGVPHSKGFYKQYTCTVSGTVLTIPQVELQSTLDSTVQNARYSAYLYDSAARYRYPLLVGFVVSDELAPACTWEALTLANQGTQINFFNQTWTIPQIIEYVQSLVGSGTTPYASELVAGKTALDLDPVLSSEPIAIGVNSNRIEKNLYDDYGNDFDTALAAIGATEVVLIVKNPVTRITNLAVPGNIMLDFRDAGMLTANGCTVTIGAMTDAPNKMIFAGSGTITLDPAATTVVNLTWWANKSNSTWGFTQALASVGSGGKILLPAGNTLIDADTFTLTNGIVIQGVGSDADATKGTVLKMVIGSGADYLLKISNNYRNVTLRDLTLDVGNESLASNVLIQGTAPNTGAGILFDNVVFHGDADDVVYIDGSGVWEVEQITFNRPQFLGGKNSHIRINTVNGCISLNQPFFLGGNNVKSVYIESCGALTITNPTTNASPAASPEAFLYVDGPHLDINVIGGQDEGYAYSLYNNHDNSGINTTINFFGYLPQGLLHLQEYAVINVLGGSWYSHQIDCANGKAAIVSSFGEHVYGTDLQANPITPAELCDFASSNAIHITDLSYNTGFHRFLQPLRISQKANNPGNEPATTPLLSVAYPTGDVSDKRLLYLGGSHPTTGVETVGYHFYRDSNGVLQVEGNQTNFINWNFNGPMYATNFVPVPYNAPAITANTNDYDPVNLADGILRVDVTGGSWNLTGMQIGSTYPPNKGYIGKLVNISATNSLTIKHNTISTAAFRFYCPNGEDFIIPPNGACDLYYDITVSRWRAFPITIGSQIDATHIGAGNISNAEFDYLNGVTSGIQGQINLKAPITNAALVTPDIGVAAGTSLTATGLVKSSGTAGIGYTAAAIGSVGSGTWGGSVTLNKIGGAVTMDSTHFTPANSSYSVTVANSTYALGDCVVVGIVGGAADPSFYGVSWSHVSAGHFAINIRSYTDVTEALVFQFVIIKGS